MPIERRAYIRPLLLKFGALLVASMPTHYAGVGAEEERASTTGPTTRVLTLNNTAYFSELAAEMAATHSVCAWTLEYQAFYFIAVRRDVLRGRSGREQREDEDRAVASPVAAAKLVCAASVGCNERTRLPFGDCETQEAPSVSLPSLKANN